MRTALFLTSLLTAGFAAGSAHAQKIENPIAVFSGLDKITGRIISFEAAIDETVQFGSLQLTSRVCYTRPPTESPNTTSFIEHPVYDIWLVDCRTVAQSVSEAALAEEAGPDTAGTIADHPLPPRRPPF